MILEELAQELEDIQCCCGESGAAPVVDKVHSHEEAEAFAVLGR